MESGLAYESAVQINSLLSADSEGGFREPPGCPGYLIHGPTREVWSVPRDVPAKGGTTRRIAARHIKPYRGRVSLSVNGVKRNYSVNVLWTETFPDLREQERLERYGRPIGRCLHGHPLTADDLNDPAVAWWGSFNRVCRLCQPHLPQHPAFDKGRHSAFWGT
jgi:hypothetical protein